MAHGGVLPSVSAATDAVDTVTITVPVSCSLTGTVDTAHTATISSGTYQANIGQTTFKVLCNDASGFAIYAIGYTNDEYGNNVLEAGSPLTSTYDIATGTATSGNISNWAMKVEAVSGTYAPTIATDASSNSFANYHAVPDTYTKVASFPSSTDATTGSSIHSTYAAYISGTQPAGTYTGQVKYAVVHPASAAAPPEVDVIGNMQDVSTWASSVTSGQGVYAVDSRDGKIYTVARLADGNLWMTQNLDHDIDSTRTYTSTDTDLPSGTTWAPERSTYTTGTTTWGLYDEVNDYYYGYERPESYDPGDLYVDMQNESTASTGDSHNHLGNYYNWTAAMAMNDSSSYTSNGTLVDQSICPAGWTLPRAGYGDDTFYALANEYGWDSSEWMMPSGVELWTSPTYFALSGDWYGSLGDVGYDGFFWSPVVDGSYYAYGLGLNSDGVVNPGLGDVNRRGGSSVRCVARPVASSVTFEEP